MKNIFLAFFAFAVLIACDTTNKAVDTGMEKADDKMAEVKEEVMEETSFRSKAPAPGPARSINLGEYETFKLDNGLQVIVVENHKVPRVSWQLSLDRDPIVEGKRAGYVSFAGDMMSKGTTTKSKAEIDDAVDFMGASLSSSSTGMFASSLTKHKESLLEIMTDVLYNPAFPEEELEKIRRQSLSGLAQSKENPDAISANVTNALRYGLEHPYGEMMTEETVNSITIDDVKEYYNTYYKPNIAYLVVVGDIVPADAKMLAEKYFGSWESGDVPELSYDFPQQPSNGPVVAMVNRDGAVQSVVKVTNVIDYTPDSPDRIKARVMNAILGGGVFSGRLMQNLREDKGYTYGARSQLADDDLVGFFNAGAAVRNEVTDSSVHEFLYEVNKIRDEPVSADELSLVKNVLAGSFARSLESPQTIARMALNTVKYGLPSDYYQNYLKDLEAVSIADVQAMAQKYIRPENMIVTVVGSRDDVAEKLARFSGSGKVMHYDTYANEIKMEDQQVSSDITAETIHEDYFTALGGRDKLEAVKSYSTVASGNMMGQNITMTMKVIKPSKVYMKMGSDMMTFVEQKYNGVRAVMSGMQTGGQEVEIEEEDMGQIKEMGQIFPELGYADRGIESEFIGLESEGGVNYYKIKYNMPNGVTVVSYFDQETSLKAKSVVTSEQGSMTFEQKDYQEVDGIMFPFKSVTSGGGIPVPMTMTVDELLVNPDIPMTTFLIE